MNDESPIAALERTLKSQFGIEKVDNLQAMIILEAVRMSFQPPPTMTLAALRSILRSLEPHAGLEMWADKCSREIVRVISRHPQVREAAKLIDNEGVWCQLEGTISAMLIRVTRGQDINDPQETNPSDYSVRELRLMEARDAAQARAERVETSISNLLHKVEYLEFFREQAFLVFGPADDDIRRNIDQSFKTKFGKDLPRGYKDE